MTSVLNTGASLPYNYNLFKNFCLVTDSSTPTHTSYVLRRLSNTLRRLSSATRTGQLSQSYNKTAHTPWVSQINKRNSGLTDPCIDLICRNTVRTNTTSKKRETFHKFEHLFLDCKWRVQWLHVQEHEIHFVGAKCIPKNRMTLVSSSKSTCAFVSSSKT
ncbi:hypothetical protein CSKR_106557 [Clonorchis sinensis]|uniref:Uncharacterized protein n=1 Tax=Clonorchis sinensis TaxID=79923 RepID=A0A419Q469_CLOSI|nr:hypothetical protein CSKR_106557 [Clonorchis sinensis]